MSERMWWGDEKGGGKVVCGSNGIERVRRDWEMGLRFGEEKGGMLGD